MSTNLSSLVETNKRNNTIILVFADNKFRDVVLNWLLSVHRLDITNYVIVAWDKTLYKYLSDKGFPCHLSEFDNSKKEWDRKTTWLWWDRVRLVGEVNKLGVDVIHSDADAIWMQDPHSFFCESDADFIFSAGTTYPSDVAVKQKFVFCTGLYASKANNTTTAVIEEVLPRIKADTGDCQIAFNRILYDADIQWDSQSPTKSIPVGQLEFNCYANTLQGTTANGIRIDLLPHDQFQRVHVPAATDVYVKHLFFVPTKNALNNKFLAFDEAGLLFLKDGWENIPFDRNTILTIAKKLS